MEVQDLPGRRRHYGDRRHRGDLRQVHELGGLHRLGAIGALSAGRILRQRRVHPGAPDLHSGRRQAAADVGIGARRRRPRLGAEAAGRQARYRRAFRRASAGTSWKSGIRSTATWCRATSPPAPFTRWFMSTSSASTAQPMVYLDLTHIDRATLDKKLEGILEIYEKFVGDDPRDVPMKIFPGMHYTMGGMWVDIRPGDQHSGTLCLRRMRLLDPRRKPPGREFTAVLHLWRIRCRAGSGAIRPEREGRKSERSLRSREESARKKSTGH